MRMQLRRSLYGGLLMFAVVQSHAQSDNDPEKKVHLEDIEITFLSSYYTQDGNHSPVTGGRGTEQLTNIAPAVIVNVPLDTVHSISAIGGVDFYSSASSDNINNPYLLPNHVSGASGSDVRGYATITYKNKSKARGVTKGVFAGFSREYDVNSLSVGALYTKTSKDNNRELGLKASYYYDDWKLIYPTELRGITDVPYLDQDKRHSVNFTITGSSVINKRLSMALTGDFVYQTGLLSTPFHRVYFTGVELPRVEQLPSTRLKVPVGIRFNYHLADQLILRTYYRYYWDDWNLTSNTAKIEVPVKISNSLRVTPFYRYHTQSAAQYFAPFEGHDITDEFYTADFDLSTFQSNQFGMGVNITPLFGIARYKSPLNRKKVGMIKNIELRYSYYMRTDGLKASIFSLAMKFTIPR